LAQSLLAQIRNAGLAKGLRTGITKKQVVGSTAVKVEADGSLEALNKRLSGGLVSRYDNEGEATWHRLSLTGYGHVGRVDLMEKIENGSGFNGGAIEADAQLGNELRVESLRLQALEFFGPAVPYAHFKGPPEFKPFNFNGLNGKLRKGHMARR
jgi:hypothetical protein